MNNFVTVYKRAVLVYPLQKSNFLSVKLEEARGEVNKMVADADGQYLKDKIEADVYQEHQQLLAKAIQAEGIAEATGIQEMNNALAGSGGEAIVKLRIAEAIQGKRIILLPVSEGGMNFKTTNINRLIETLGVKPFPVDNDNVYCQENPGIFCEMTGKNLSEKKYHNLIYWY